MKRCTICDSTEESDTMYLDGIDDPIEYWVWITNDGWRCSRCDLAVEENLYVLSMDDDEPTEDNANG